MGEPPRQGTADQSAREDVDKNAILQRTKWADLPAACRDFPLGNAVASSACFPGGFPPMLVPGLFDDLTVELVDGGVHDNQGVEGLVDRGCSHWIISDGSGQMPDIQRPSTRLPAVLGRVISIYGDAEREQRLLQLLREGGSVAFMHLQTGLPARERTPGGKVSEKDAHAGVDRLRRARGRAARARAGAHRPRRLLRGRGLVADGRRLPADRQDRPDAGPSSPPSERRAPARSGRSRSSPSSSPSRAPSSSRCCGRRSSGS